MPAPATSSRLAQLGSRCSPPQLVWKIILCLPGMGKMAANQSRLQKKKKKTGRKELPTNKTPGTGCGTELSPGATNCHDCVFPAHCQAGGNSEQVQGRAEASSKQSSPLKCAAHADCRSPPREERKTWFSCAGGGTENALWCLERGQLWAGHNALIPPQFPHLQSGAVCCQRRQGELGPPLCRTWERHQKPPTTSVQNKNCVKDALRGELPAPLPRHPRKRSHI